MQAPAIFHFPLALPFWIVFFVAFVREAKVVRPAFAETDTSQDAGTFRALMIGSPLAMLAALAVAWIPGFAISASVVTPIVGMLAIIAGAALRRYCFYALGASFTGVVIVKEDQRIVQTGPYRLVRHPSYTAAFVMFIGVGLALESWLSLAILFFAHCYLYGMRVVAEEKALVKTLGEPYVAYMRRTKRFLPFLV